MNRSQCVLLGRPPRKGHLLGLLGPVEDQVAAAIRFLGNEKAGSATWPLGCRRCCGGAQCAAPHSCPTMWASMEGRFTNHFREGGFLGTTHGGFSHKSCPSSACERGSIPPCRHLLSDRQNYRELKNHTHQDKLGTPPQLGSNASRKCKFAVRAIPTQGKRKA